MSNNFTIEKLTGRDNYPTWKFAMQSYLEHEELWDAIEGKEKDEKKVKKAKAKIILCIDPVIYVHVQECKDAKEVWESLEKVFADSGLTRRISLLRTLITTRMENCDSVEDYVNTVIATAHKLNGIGLKVDDEWVGCILLAGLPDEYKPMIMGLESSAIKITADLVKTKILQDVKLDQASSSNALIAKKGPFNKSWKNAKSVRCFNCNEEGHYSKFCPERSTEVKKKASLCAVLNTGNFVNPNDWYFDSGATCHMTKHKNWVKKMKIVKDSVNIANNFHIQVKGKGKCEVSANCGNYRNDVNVEDVSYVPELSTNLLSISKITEKGNKVIFSKSKCEVLDSSNRTIAVGIVENGLYKLCKFQDNCMMTSKVSSQNLQKLNYDFDEKKKKKSDDNTMCCVSCWFCKRRGHMKRNCQKYKIWKQKKQADSISSAVKEVTEEKINFQVRKAQVRAKQYVCFDLFSDEVGDSLDTLSSENEKELEKGELSENQNEASEIADQTLVPDSVSDQSSSENEDSSEESEKIEQDSTKGNDEQFSQEETPNLMSKFAELQVRKSERTKKKPFKCRQL